MAANGITAQYKITLKGLLKQKSNVGSGLFNHIFIDVSLWGASAMGGYRDMYILTETHTRIY